MKVTTRMWRCGLLLAAIAGGIGCDDDDNEHAQDLSTPATADLAGAVDASAPADLATQPGDASVAGDAGAAAAPLTDSQIVYIMQVTNQGEIDLGNLGKSKGQDSRITGYGSEMVTAHTANNAAVAALAAQLNLTPAPSTLSDRLQQEYARIQSELNGKAQGMPFDQDYIVNMVALHNQILGIIDGELVPATSNATLTTFLKQNFRAMEATHLQEASAIWAGFDP